jgi:hypothetical protein
MNIERTGKRDLTYSEFLRSCSVACSDLDFVIYDYANDKIIAIIETKEGFDNYPSEYQHKLYLNVSKTLNVPYYFIQYTTAELDDEKKEIRYITVTKGESLIVKGKSGSAEVINTGDRTFQFLDQHIKWIKNLISQKLI